MGSQTLIMADPTDIYELYVARDEASLAGLPDDLGIRMAYYAHKFIQVKGGCLRKVQDGVPGPI